MRINLESEKSVESLFFAENKMPTLPGLFLKFKSMINQSYISVNQVSDFIKNDQSMVAKIVQLSNSAYYSKRQKVDTLPRAIAYLGLDVIKNMVFQITLIKTFQFKIPDNVFNPDIFWRHSLATAYVTEMIADCYQIPRNENHYLGGLLHDIGKLLLYQFYPEKFEEVWLKHRQGQNWLDAEREIIGVDHGEIASFLVAKWGFSKEIEIGIRNHHHLFQDPDEADLLSLLIRGANIYCHFQKICLDPDHCQLEGLNFDIWDMIGKKTKRKIQTDQVLNKIEDSMEMISDAVNLTLSGQSH